jgi:hypothetical protein
MESPDLGGVGFERDVIEGGRRERSLVTLPPALLSGVAGEREDPVALLAVGDLVPVEQVLQAGPVDAAMPGLQLADRGRRTVQQPSRRLQGEAALLAERAKLHTQPATPKGGALRFGHGVIVG